ncbi:hypothetical protein V6615_14935 [Oscillospiraceae bacterium PP1C4]
MTYYVRTDGLSVDEDLLSVSLRGRNFAVIEGQIFSVHGDPLSVKPA